MTVQKLFEGDPRLQAILDAVLETVYERGKGLPVPSIIGILELAKMSVAEDAASDD